MLNNMKVSVRLFILIGIFMIFMIILSIVGLTQLGSVEYEYDKITTNIVPSMYQISIIRGSMNRVVIYEKRHILNTEAHNLTEIEQGLTEKKAEIRQILSDYEKYVIPEERQIFDLIKSEWNDYLTIHEQVLTLSRAQKIEEARALSGGEGNTKLITLTTALSKWADLNIELSDKADLSADNIGNQAQTMMIIIPIISALAAFFIGIFIANSITQPINRLRGVAEMIASGNLNQRAEESGSEVGAMARTFNVMADNLRQRLENEQEQRQRLQTTVEQYVVYMGEVARGNLKERVNVYNNGHAQNDPLMILGQNLNEMTANLQRMIGQIRDTASNLNSASAEILAATTQQASGASEQSAAISQTTTTVSEVKAIAEQSSQRAQDVANSSQRTVEVSRNGQTAVEETINSMSTIKQRVEGIAENILSLSEQTQQIGEIIATVNEIAAQSNMLALNASVEAARAGEHGKGFAVVALEVRNLAEQSRNATSQVKSILSEIQKATNSTVMATEEGTKGVEQGVQTAYQARSAIESLSKVINQSAQTAMQVSAGGQQQVSGIDQISLAMQNINQATIQSLASTRQAEKAAQNLNDLSSQLMVMVRQYQL